MTAQIDLVSALCKCGQPVHEPSPEMQQRREELAAKHGRPVRPVALCPVCILDAIMRTDDGPTRAMKRCWRRRVHRCRYTFNIHRSSGPTDDGSRTVRNWDPKAQDDRVIVAPWLRGATS